MKKKTNPNKNKATFDFFNEKLMGIVNKQQPVISNKIQEEQISTMPTPAYEIEIKNLMQKYHPLDVFKSILIAENFLDNNDHYIKFSLLFEIFFSISKDKFKGEKICSYQCFSNFTSDIFAKLPHNSSMEDFFPVKDWGEIKYQLDGKLYKVFYGSPLSDNFGYLKGFEIVYKKNKEAMQDLRQVFDIQDSLISNVKKLTISEKSNGKLEVPCESFWMEMLNWIKNFSVEKVNHNLVVKNGFERRVLDFYERYSNADVNPYCYYEYEGKFYPFSLRNHIAILVDHYSNKNIANKNTNTNLSNFLNNNLDNIIFTDFKVRNNTKILDYIFSAVFQSEENTYFVLCLTPDELENIKTIKNNLRKMINNSDWGIQKLYSPLGLQPRGLKGEVLTYDKIKFIIVINDLTTLPKFLTIQNEENFKFISIPDFVSIIDSINSKEDLDGFINFHTTYAPKTLFLGFNLDCFASYRESYGLLEDGAVNFSLIHVDTHSAHYFKFNSLKENYSELPKFLPTSEKNWIAKNYYDEIVCLLARDYSCVSWSTEINNAIMHFLFEFKVINSHDDIRNPNVLELFCQAAADAFSQRRDILSKLDISKNITFKVNVGRYIEKDISSVSKSFLVGENLLERASNNLIIELFLDLNYCFSRFTSDKSADFQNEICKVLLNTIDQYYKIPLLVDILHSLESTKDWPLRMTMGTLDTKFDIVEKKPKEISEYRYKLARQKIAFILKENNIEPNIYNDSDLAKIIVNNAADELREYIHNILKNRNTSSIIDIALDDYNSLVTDNYIKTLKQKQSLKHQVSYNRSERLAELDSDFMRNSQNHRYLIECSLMLSNETKQPISIDEYLDLLAHVHWLLNLYYTSDGLHFGIGVDGIEVDSTYIPEIHIPQSTQDLESKFYEEISSYKLGIGLNSEDELESIISKDDFKLIDDAFYKDLGFSYKNLFTVLYSLANWSNFANIEAQTFYKSDFEVLVKILFDAFTIEDISLEEVEKIVQFLIIDNDKINQLEGIEKRHYDVPVGDHNKRTNRINIKPLIRFQREIIWSPACAYRTLGIWTNHTNDGYLPADFNLPKVKDLISKSKNHLEKQLETKAFNVLTRRTPYIKHGIDLKKTFFKTEEYPDVGDYDVLAYFPQSNRWVMVECKYNQPAYCLKDMNRLRTKIFGKDELDSKSHISKVKGRYDLLLAESEKIRKSLKWPEPTDGVDLKITNLYISKNTYWWFRFPPYEVNLNFVQIDFLDQWLKDNFDASVKNV